MWKGEQLEQETVEPVGLPGQMDVKDERATRVLSTSPSSRSAEVSSLDKPRETLRPRAVYQPFGEGREQFAAIGAKGRKEHDLNHQ